MELNINLFSKERVSFSGLKASIMNFATPEERMSKLRKWFGESVANNLSLSELYLIKSRYVLVENYAEELIELWTDKNKNLTNLVELVKSFTSDSQDDLFNKKLFNAIFRNFSQQADFNFLIYAVDAFSSGFYKNDIIDCWHQYNSFNFQGLLVLIHCLQDFNSMVLVNQYIRNNRDISVNNICEIIANFKNFFDRSKIIGNFIKETKHDFSDQDILSISSLLDQDSYRRTIENIIYSKNTSNLCRKMQLIAERAESEEGRNYLIKHFLSNFTEDVAEPKFLELLRLVKNDKDIVESIDIWIKKTNGELSINGLLEIVNLIDNQLFKKKCFFNWSEKKLFKMPLEDLLKIISHMEKNDYSEAILSSWILNNAEKINAQQLIEIVSLIIDEEAQIASFKNWFYSPNYSPNLFDFVLVLKHNSSLAEELIPVFFGLFNDDEDIKLQKLISLINDFQYIDIFCIPVVVDLFLETSLDIKLLPDLIFAIYPNNELMWAEVIKSFLINDRIEDDEYEDVVIPVIQRITNSEIALELIEVLNETFEFELNGRGLLNVVKGRFRANNESAVNILKNITINGDDANNLGIFNIGALDKLQLIFGKEIKNDLIEERVGLVDILSYYEIKKLLPNFVIMLNDAVRLQIKNETEFINRKPFLLKEELATLQILTDNKFNPIKTKAICEYFKKIINLETIDQQTLSNYKIKFGESSNFISQEKQIVINDFFVDMIFLAIREESSAELEENVEAFFYNAMSGADEGVKLSQGNLKTLTKFTKYYHQEIYNLFMQENGFSKLISEVHALNDGCIHNLGNKINIIVSDALIKNQADSMLYQTMIEKVVIPVINSKNDSIANEKSFLTNKDVLSSFMIPEIFLQESLKIFYDPQNKSTPINQDSWEFIAKNCGQEKRDEIMSKIEEVEKINQLGAEVATVIFFDKLLENFNNSSLCHDDKKDLVNFIGDMQQGLFKSNEVFLSRAGILSAASIYKPSNSQKLHSPLKVQLP